MTDATPEAPFGLPESKLPRTVFGRPPQHLTDAPDAAPESPLPESAALLIEAADTLRKWWRFDDAQQHTHSWHDREDFIRDELPRMLNAAVAQLRARLRDSDCEVASLADFVNQWARQARVRECDGTPDSIKRTVGLLWDEEMSLVQKLQHRLRECEGERDAAVALLREAKGAMDPLGNLDVHRGEPHGHAVLGVDPNSPVPTVAHAVTPDNVMEARRVSNHIRKALAKATRGDGGGT